METLRVAFVDGASSALREFMFQVLSHKFNCIIDEEKPDIVVYSVFGDKHIDYDCIRIFYTGENCRADFNFCDYAITFDYLEFEGRHLRYPLYLFYDEINDLLKPQTTLDISYAKRKFCSFVVSNGKADEMRVQFFDLLSGYKRVDSGGRYKNNIGGAVSDKQAFLEQYKFNVCFENSSTSGYLTEKLFQAKAAKSIPIYWGDTSLNGGGWINPKALVNVSDFASLNEAVEFIKHLDSDDNAYMAMLNQPLILDTTHKEQMDRKLEAFLLHIATSKELRRGFGQWRMNIENRYRKFKRARKIVVGFQEPIKCFFRLFRWKK